MEQSELLALIDNLDPDNYQVTEALAFLRLVVKNNPEKSAAQIVKRPDVKEAMTIVDDWIEGVRRVTKLAVTSLPGSSGKKVVDSVTVTLNGFTKDSTVNEKRVGEWRDSPEAPEAWAAKIILRMRWLLEWIRKQIEGLIINAPFKTWVCRMAANSCSFCKALNGVTIPVGKSFAVEARKAGYTRIYGGLYAPPLHPRCQCFLRASDTPGN